MIMGKTYKWKGIVCGATYLLSFYGGIFLSGVIKAGVALMLGIIIPLIVRSFLLPSREWKEFRNAWLVNLAFVIATFVALPFMKLFISSFKILFVKSENSHLVNKVLVAFYTWLYIPIGAVAVIIALIATEVKVNKYKKSEGHYEEV